MDTLVITLLTAQVFTAVLGKDYCASQIFQAECEPDEVIIMLNATYGRMEVGTCVITDYGYVGCSKSVIGILDRRCSGRRKCEMRVASPELEAVHACEREFKLYLRAEYMCQKVVHMETCHSSDRIQLTAPSGLLSSALSEETGCGTDVRPWYIEALPGQTISFTLHDFNVRTPPDACILYVILTEPGSNNRHSVCGSKQPLSHVYTTLGNAVEVRFIKKSNTSLTGQVESYFILQYNVSGCVDPQLPIGTQFERFGNTAIIQCPHHKWTITCVGNTWQGEYQNCSFQGSDVIAEDILKVSGRQPASKRWLPFPIDISIALIVSVAFVISCCIFVVGIFVLRRRNLEQIRRRRETILLMEARDASFGKYPPYPQPAQPPYSKDDLPPQGQSQGRQGQIQIENDYAYIADFPPPPSPRTLQKLEKQGYKHVPKHGGNKPCHKDNPTQIGRLQTAQIKPGSHGLTALQDVSTPDQRKSL